MTTRRMLARGEQPATVAMELGFADQSHLGRWFVRAYGLTPALYRKRPLAYSWSIPRPG